MAHVIEGGCQCAISLRVISDLFCVIHKNQSTAQFRTDRPSEQREPHLLSGRSEQRERRVSS